MTAVIAPIPVAPRFLYLDLPMMIGAALLLVLWVFTRPAITRIPAMVLLLAYPAYIYATV